MNRRIIICFLLLIGIAGCIAWYAHLGKQEDDAGPAFWQAEGVQQEEAADSCGEQEGTEEASIYVHVCGEVKHAGVYELPAAARVSEAVEAAGGFTKKADAAAVNLARPAVDAEQIVIPRKTGRTARGTKDMPQDTVAEEALSLVNINTADENMLMTLNGIGQAKAEAIVSYRTEQGTFAKIEDITKVPGIKSGIYNQIKDNICV